MNQSQNEKELSYKLGEFANLIQAKVYNNEKDIEEIKEESERKLNKLEEKLMKAFHRIEQLEIYKVEFSSDIESITKEMQIKLEHIWTNLQKINSSRDGENAKLYNIETEIKLLDRKLSWIVAIAAFVLTVFFTSGAFLINIEANRPIIINDERLEGIKK